jgi:hypothetical protein
MAKKRSRKAALEKRSKRISYGHRQSFAMKDLDPKSVPTPITYSIKKGFRTITAKKKYFEIFSETKIINARFKEIEYRYCGYPLIKKFILQKYKIQESVFDILMFVAPLGIFTGSDFEFFFSNIADGKKLSVSIFVGMGVITRPHELENNLNKVYKLAPLGYDIVNDFFFYMDRFHKFGTLDYLEKKEILIGYKGDDNLKQYRDVISEIYREIKSESGKVERVKRELKKTYIDESDIMFIEMAYFYFKQSSKQICEITSYTDFTVRTIISKLRRREEYKNFLRNKQNYDGRFEEMKKLWTLHIRRKG